MAVFPEYAGLSVEIVVRNQPLEEYNEDTDLESKPRTVTKYIEAREGEYFSVRYTIPSTLPNGMEVEVEIDGEYMPSDVVEKSELELSDVTESISTSCARINGKDMGQRFRFSPINACEATTANENEVKLQLKSVGQIKITMHAITKVRNKTIVPVTLPKIREYEKVSEKALKGSTLSHTTSLGPVKEVEKTRWVDVDYVHGKNSPLATFIFRYRSLAALKSLCIIPRTPSPEPLEDRSIETLTPAELAELVNRLRAEKAESQRLKQESRTAIKRERSTEPEDDDEVTFLSMKRLKYIPTEDDGAIVLD